MKILLLEDDVVLCDILEDFLGEFGEVASTFSSDEVWEMAQDGEYDLFIFDINVAGSQNGIELLSELRSFNDTTPAIIITAYSDIEHLKSAFKSGANDFIRKPFELEELAMRIENIKRTFGLQEVVAIGGGMSLYPQSKELEKRGKRYHLSKKDAKILHYLVKNRHRTVSNEELIQNIWDFDSLPSEATLRSHIRTIRNIVGSDAIETLRGVGYRWML